MLSRFRAHAGAGIWQYESMSPKQETLPKLLIEKSVYSAGKQQAQSESHRTPVSHTGLYPETQGQGQSFHSYSYLDVFFVYL